VRLQRVHTLHRELWVPQSLSVVFEFFSRAENLQRITPPWMEFRILTPLPIAMKQGATIAYALRVRGISLRWFTEIERWNPPYEFVDVQAKGPYKLWRHTHRFSDVAGGTSLVDHVDYELPFGALGRAVHRLQVARDLSRIFDYRAQRVQDLLENGGNLATQMAD
jgi:ligand-binding SRPBCC domain-containing protein